MAFPGWLADGIARLAQKGPGGPRLGPELRFDEIAGTTEHVTIPTRHGDVAATLYVPEGRVVDSGVYVNLHGGGYVFRHPEQDDPLCRYLAAKAGVVVVNVDYDVAPGLRFPGPVEEAYDVLLWASAAERPWDGGRLAIGGQSAGGGLAAGAARLALEQGGPRLALQVLMYPPLDLSVPAKSKHSPGKERLLVPMGPIFDTAYVPPVELRADRLVSPAGAADAAVDLTGIAPAVVVTAEKDILREEGVRYAERLRGVGALVEHVDLDGVGHGFNILGSTREVVEEVYSRIAEAVRGALR